MNIRTIAYLFQKLQKDIIDWQHSNSPITVSVSQVYTLYSGICYKIFYGIQVPKELQMQQNINFIKISMYPAQIVNKFLTYNGNPLTVCAADIDFLIKLMFCCI